MSGRPITFDHTASRIAPSTNLAAIAIAFVLALGHCVFPPGLRAAGADSSTGAADSTAAPDSARTPGITFPRPDSTLVPNLRAGGYVIVFRHSITDWGQRDVDGEHFEDRAAQRNLSKEGEAQATAIGKAFDALKIPVLAALSSPMWRCRDTAQIAFGQNQPIPELFRRGAEYRTFRIVLLSTVVEEEENLVIVTHQDLLLPIIRGLKRDQLKEGDCLIVKPQGEAQFDIVAHVTPEDWAAMAAGAAKK